MFSPVAISQRFFLWLLLTMGGLSSGCRSPVVPYAEAQLMQTASSAAPIEVDYSSNSETTWAFQPPEDTFDSESQLDLRGLNEAIAGETGFVRRSPDGNDFVRGDGKPLRFWGINLNPPSKKSQLTDKQLQVQAEFLAKRGVNLVRMHRSLPSKLATSSLSDINPAVREDIWRTTAAMKQSGIYVTISPYWPMRFNPKQPGRSRKIAKGFPVFYFLIRNSNRPTKLGGKHYWSQ